MITQDTKLSAHELAEQLEDFHGTEEYHIYNFFGFKVPLTEGIKFLCDNAECYWLIDAILSHQVSQRVRREEFQVWELRKVKNKRKPWVLVATDGNKNVLVTQRIEFSTFPLKYIKIYFTGDVLLLPSEY